MVNLKESRDNHGKIDLTPLIKPIIDLIEIEDAKHLLREQNGKIYIITDEIIRRIIENKKGVENLLREGELFSNTEYAKAIATLDKNHQRADEQKKQITRLEEAIYDALQSKLAGKEAAFFGQSATAYFTALTTLANRKMEIAIPQRGVFPEAHLSKAYPGTKALLRVPRHTIQITADFSKSFVQAVKKTMAKRLSKADYPDDEIDVLIEKVEQGINEQIGCLSIAKRVFEENAYGRIRRTYACCILEKMATKLDAHSPAMPYIRRVSDFNELVQGTLPNSGLSANDLVVEFPNANGKGVMSFDLSSEFSQAETLNVLPFWFSFSELLSEVTTTDSVTTSLGQHFKMNGEVPSEGFNSVFEFNVNKLKIMATEIKNAQEKGQDFPSETDIRKVLRVVTLYYIVFYNYSKPQSNVVENYKEFCEKLANLVTKKVNLNTILAKIATGLTDRAALDHNRAIGADFKKLLQSRKLDDVEPKEKLYLTISTDILSNTDDMEDAEPIVALSSQQYSTVYLKYLKVTRHYEGDAYALIKVSIDLTESLRYLTLPQDSSQRQREMIRDINRNVLGVLFTPRDNNMRRFPLAFEDMTNLIISYDRQQMSGHQDEYLTGLARLIYVLLVYGVFKGVERLERQYQQDIRESSDENLTHANRTMLLMLSLFSTQPLVDETREHKHFTHDAHKAIEHIIKQYLPTKSQGFQLRQSKRWDQLVIQGEQPNKDEVKAHIQQDINKDYRAANIIEGLCSGLDALWRLPEKPSLEKIALMVVTSRACDKTRHNAPGDRKVLYGEIHRFEYESSENAEGEVFHFYRHQPVQAFCDDMDTADSFKKPAVLFNTIRQLHQTGFEDILIVTKVPFTRRIRMTIEEESSYTKPEILQALNQEMPSVRIYPLFTQKSYGVRLPPKKPKQAMFLPHDPNYDEPLPDEEDKSTLFRAASVLTNRVVGREDNRTHSGITDYLFRWYPETVSIQSEAMATLRHPETRACLHEVLRFLHANAHEQFLKTQDNEKPLEAKLDALDNIIGDGDNNLGHQANSLPFPKPQKNQWRSDKTSDFSINMIALLKHLENQSAEQRKRSKRFVK
jgi:hypothetical protein